MAIAIVLQIHTPHYNGYRHRAHKYTHRTTMAIAIVLQIHTRTTNTLPAHLIAPESLGGKTCLQILNAQGNRF
jgi:hypothetical protein